MYIFNTHRKLCLWSSEAPSSILQEYVIFTKCLRCNTTHLSVSCPWGSCSWSLVIDCLSSLSVSLLSVWGKKKLYRPLHGWGAPQTPGRAQSRPERGWLPAFLALPGVSFYLFSIAKSISIRLGSLMTPGISLSTTIIIGQFTFFIPTQASAGSDMSLPLPTESFPWGAADPPLGSCPHLTCLPHLGHTIHGHCCLQGGLGRAFFEGKGQIQIRKKRLKSPSWK